MALEIVFKSIDPTFIYGKALQTTITTMPAPKRYFEALCTLLPLLLAPADATLSMYQLLLVFLKFHVRLT